MLWGGRCDLCGQPAAGLCGPCRDALDPPVVPDLRPEVDAVVAIFAYLGAGAELVRALKFANRRASIPVLVAAATPLLLGAVDAVVAVPPETARMRKRGYDLPRLVAGDVARRLGVPVRDVLRRVDHGSQRHRARSERTAIAGYRGRGPVSGRILLVDDVVTTGATARRCAAELRRFGADTVILLGLAATPLAASSSLADTTATIKPVANSEVTPRCR